MNDPFDIILQDSLKKCDLNITPAAREKLGIYYHLLIEWNERMNLTALTSAEDVACKHFCDSLTLLKYEIIPENATLIDVGTGAGFPGMALKAARPDLRVTLLDSLNKRLIFLSEVCREMGADDVRLIHSRAEDAGREEEYREKYDYAVSRAVAPLNVLCEYCLPFVKLGGMFLAMKGKDAEEELSSAQNAIRALGAEVERIHTFELPDAGQRSIIALRKTAPTPALYPRSGKKIRNKPI